MARAIEQIERDIAALCEAAKAIAAELSIAYTSYLISLGQAMRQQLILASYQLCTQGYPKQFLNLSFSQRQQLQQAIRKLAKHAADQLLAQLKSEDKEQTSQNSASEGEGDDVGGGDDVGDVETPTTPLSSPSPLSSLFSLSSSLPLAPHSSSSPSNPIELVEWQRNLEEAIAYTLKTLSLETNRLLQQAGILPQKLPAPLLEVATVASESAGAAEMTSGPPNLLNLLIETENQPESENSSVTQLIAIQLRLAEIEFGDANVRAARNQIRMLEGRINSLGREYQKKQRERIVAEAEAAWRISWFDE